MIVKKWPERMSLTQGVQYLTAKNGGYRMYCEATLRRKVASGELVGQQMGKGKKIWIYRSELDRKILDLNNDNDDKEDT